MKIIQRMIEKNGGVGSGIIRFQRTLRFCSLVYGRAVRVRTRIYEGSLPKRFRLGVKVISVGNITVGGTGKTPLVMFLAKMFQQQGLRVAIISRGYRRRSKGIQIVSDGQHIRLSRRKAGDEPYLFARKLQGIPVIVGKNRFLAGLLAIKRFSSQVILLDDGFQYMRLERDIDIVTVDGQDPFGNGYLLPKGKLREPLESLKRADMFFITRADQCETLPQLRELLRDVNPDAPILECTHHALFLRAIPSDEKVGLESLRGRKVVALSSIGNPKAFEKTLENLGAKVVTRIRYLDHHRYTYRNLYSIVDKVKKAQAEWIVTTEKDAVRFPAGFGFELPVFTLEIEIEVRKGKQYLAQMVRNPWI